MAMTGTSEAEKMNRNGNTTLCVILPLDVPMPGIYGWI